MEGFDIVIAAWSTASRCQPDSGNTLMYNAPLPTDLIIPSDGNNYATAISLFSSFSPSLLPSQSPPFMFDSVEIVLEDNNTLFQTQPLCKCETNTPFTTYVNAEGFVSGYSYLSLPFHHSPPAFMKIDTKKEYLDGQGTWGSHGGSGLSSIGGIFFNFIL